jgi:hypothetical protein
MLLSIIGRLCVGCRQCFGKMWMHGTYCIDYVIHGKESDMVLLVNGV